MTASSSRDVERHDLVAGAELHAPHAGRVAAHRAHLLVLVVKRIVMPLRDTRDVVGAVRLDDPHQLVAVAQVERDEAVATRLVVLGHQGLLHLAVLGGEEQVPLGREVAGVDDRLDVLVGRERQQVDDRHALRRALPLGDLVRAQPVHLAPVREEQQVGVGRGVKDGLTRSSSLSLAPATPRPPRPWVWNASASTVLT